MASQDPAARVQQEQEFSTKLRIEGKGVAGVAPRTVVSMLNDAATLFAANTALATSEGQPWQFLTFKVYADSSVPFPC